MVVTELAILQHLKTSKAAHPNIIVLHDSFKISGPNGEHQCLTFAVLGPCLKDNEDISAVSFLHENGICHGYMFAFPVFFKYIPM